MNEASSAGTNVQGVDFFERPIHGLHQVRTEVVSVCLFVCALIRQVHTKFAAGMPRIRPYAAKSSTGLLAWLKCAASSSRLRRASHRLRRPGSPTQCGAALRQRRGTRTNQSEAAEVAT